jgi:hypothetical protein
MHPLTKTSAPVAWIRPRELPVTDGRPPCRRLRPAADLAWSPADAVLATRNLSNLVVLAATLGVAVLCVRYDGLGGLIANLPGLAVVWGAAYGLIRLGRWWRGVNPPEHHAIHRHRAKPLRAALITKRAVMLRPLPAAPPLLRRTTLGGKLSTRTRQ